MNRILVAAVLVVIVALAANGYELLTSSSSTASPIELFRSEQPAPHDVHRGGLGEAGGAIPDGTTVFDDSVAGVANLDPDLRAALRAAATAAAGDGVAVYVDSGWRSREYQQQLFNEAVSGFYRATEAKARERAEALEDQLTHPTA